MMTSLRPSSKSTWAALGGLVSLLSYPSADVTIAQTVLDTAAVYRAEAPSPASEAATGTDERSISDASDDGLRVHAEMSRLRHLPLSPNGWRVEGETGALSWRIYLTSDEAADMRKFQFAYAAAASVLPGASMLDLRINDIRIDRRPIAVPAERRPIMVDIPQGTLRQGINTVTLRISQYHRVDCTREAAYELWTEIDPAKTGLLGAARRPALALSDLPALAARADGALVIRVLFQGKMRPERIDQTIRAAQAIALAGRFEHTLVSFTSDPNAETGVNLIVGTPTDIVETLGSANMPTNPLSPASLVSIAGQRAPTLIVRGAGNADVASAIEQITISARRDQSSPSKADAAPVAPLRIKGGERIRLDAVGLPDADFTGRLFRVPLAIELPTDFLAADYDKIFFAIGGLYSGDLTAAARLTIHINGRDAASVPLPKPSAAAFSRNDIGVPLSFFRPGRNLIEITAELPDRNQEVCSTTDGSVSVGNQFKLFGDSEIRVPHLARIAQTPALLQTAAGGYPYASSAVTPHLYVPAPDRDALASAATLAVRLAVAAGHVIPFEITLSNPPLLAGHGLVVAPARALDPASMRAIQLDPDSVRRLWQQPAPSGELQIAAPSTTPSRRTTHPVVDWMSDRIAALRSRFLGDAMPLGSISADAALIVAQGHQTGDGGVITIFTAPDTDALAKSMAQLVRPERWSALRGRLAVMNVSAQMLQTEEPSHVSLIQTQPPSFRNTRLIVAGWLSLHPAAYVGSALLIAALLAAASTTLVKNLGRRNF